ncbi:Hypothetical protein A7982_03944 [Minicystis rosea]|nr:Hypothetical protein A7982_03944 [Minicystis rosea]
MRGRAPRPQQGNEQRGRRAHAAGMDRGRAQVIAPARLERRGATVRCAEVIDDVKVRA